MLSFLEVLELVFELSLAVWRSCRAILLFRLVRISTLAIFSKQVIAFKQILSSKHSSTHFNNNS